MKTKAKKTPTAWWQFKSRKSDYVILAAACVLILAFVGYSRWNSPSNPAGQNAEHSQAVESASARQPDSTSRGAALVSEPDPVASERESSPQTRSSPPTQSRSSETASSQQTGQRLTVTDPYTGETSSKTYPPSAASSNEPHTTLSFSETSSDPRDTDLNLSESSGHTSNRRRPSERSITIVDDGGSINSSDVTLDSPSGSTSFFVEHQHMWGRNCHGTLHVLRDRFRFESSTNPKCDFEYFFSDLRKAEPTRVPEGYRIEPNKGQKFQFITPEDEAISKTYGKMSSLH